MAELKTKVVKTLSKKKAGKGQKKLAMICYNDGPVKLVNQFHYLKDGELRPGKITSLDAEDWKVVVENHKLISRLFKKYDGSDK